MAWFNSKSVKKEIPINIDGNNLFWQAFAMRYFNGAMFQKQLEIKDSVSDGYEKNPDVFSISNKISLMFANLPFYVAEMNGKKEKVIDDINLMAEPNSYQSFFEYKQMWELFLLITGNALTYIPRYEAGNDRGKAMTLDLMPSQNVDVISGGWRQPVKEYVMDFNGVVKIPAENVWHGKIFPNLDFENGKNFFGASPVAVASQVINSQNNGYDLVNEVFKHPMPPGMITTMMNDYNIDLLKADSDRFKEEWKSKYANPQNASTPIMTAGDKRYIEFGYKNLRDLQVIESNQNGMRILCNVWGVPSEIMNDKASSTYNNMNEMKKSVYTSRILPDAQLFCMGFTKHVLKAINPKWVLKVDTSQIPELQQDRTAIATYMQIGVGIGAYTRNEFREKMGDEKLTEPGMDELTVQMGTTLLSSSVVDDDLESDAINGLQANKLTGYGERQDNTSETEEDIADK
jgi:HK97 family phage portal protein